uniref:Putative c-3 sterol dehydrogenase/3-beta-hydroxysteroid dehydrogenase n=1 Tax=Amblyomma sculptum TaxID=1581419 RepID=A0A1E1XVL9_AMBSC
MGDGDLNEKYRFLILGGTGFTGRHLVDFLLKSNVASKIRVVDKVPPQMAWLNSAHKEVYEHPAVEFKSANLINPASCKAAFELPDGPFDFVINLAAETKINLPDCVYEEGILKLSRNCVKEAHEHHPKRYIELSTGHMYADGKKPSQENSSLDPWTVTAQLKLAVEQDLREMKDLDYVILRPAIVYGIADKHGIVPRILVGAVYKHLKETMKLLWTKDLKMNTVHVSDLCRAIWHLCLHGKSGEIYNVVDCGETTQGSVTDIISERFSISHGYWGTAASLLAKADMQSVVEQINEKHLSPWAEACLKDNITNTPLSPYLCQELLFDRNLSLDGSKLASTGFTCLVPEITKERISEIIDDYVEMGLFPRSLLL